MLFTSLLYLCCNAIFLFHFFLLLVLVSVRNPVSVNVSPKQNQAHPVDSLSHTPTLRQRLMEPPRVPLSPHRYPHPGATSSASPMSSPSVQASPKSVSGPLVSKGSRPQVNTPAKIIPPAQTRPGPVSPLGNSTIFASHAEDGKADGKDMPVSQPRLTASQTHPSIQQALQVEQVGESQSVKSLLAKKLSHAGSPEVDQSLVATPAIALNAGINSGQGTGPDSGFHQQPITATPQPKFKVSNPPMEIHQNQSHIIPSSTSQPIHIQQHHTVTTSLSPTPSSSLTTVGRFVIAQPPLSATSTVGNSAMSSSLMNSVFNPNSFQGGMEIQQNLNQNSILPSQNHGSQTAQYTNSHLIPNLQQNGQVTQVGTILSAQSQQSTHVQIRNSSTTSVPGNFVTQNSSHVLQNQPQNGPNQLNSSFPATAVKKMTVGQQQQSTINFMSGPVSMSSGGLLRAAPPGMSLTGQQLPRSTVAVQGTNLTQAISSPAVAALLTSNNPQGSSQMIISSPMLSGTAQGQIMTRPAQQQQQVPTTVVIQTPPGTIVMPSRQMQGGTVSFIVPPQYRQGSPVTFIQQQPSAASGVTAGVNMLPSLAIANSGGGGQSLPAQQRQIVLATPGQTIPVGMQISSLQGNAIIRNHPVCINSMQQPQQHNYVIQASSSQLSSTSASSLQSSPYQIVPQQTPPPVAGALVSNINSESQQTRSEAIHQSNMPSVVMQQVQCNGSGHDQNSSQRSPDSLIVSDSPPSPLSKSEKEMLNGKGSNVDLDTEHIKSGFKLGGKVNGLVHNTVTEHSKEVSPSFAQINSNPHGTALVNGCVPPASLPNQHANIPIQGLQIRSAGGIVNGATQNPPIGPPPHMGNGFQNQQQQPVVINQQQKQQQLLQQSQPPSHKAQVPLQPRQLLQPQQAQHPLQSQQQQVNLHQVQNQVVHIQQTQQQQTSQQAPQFQRIVSVRPAQPASHQVQQAQGAMRPRISTLSCPLDQQQQLQQSLQAGPRPASLPRSGSAPIGEAGGHINSLTNTPRGANRMPITSVPTVGKKRLPPAKPVVSTPLSETAASRLRKKKPNEVVVTPGSVQTRKQAQGQKPVHIAMQYMCEWGSCRK